MKTSSFQLYDPEEHMKKKLTVDGEWKEYRLEREYYDALTAVSWMWANLIEMRISAPWDKGVSERGVSESYARATLALAQMPMEYGKNGSSKRFDRSRWRDVSVTNPPQDTLHCEHPWSKKETKRILWECGSQALKCGAKKEDLIAPFSGILDARQGTVLLPHSRLSSLGVLSEAKGDGLVPRYGNAIREGKIRLIHRGTGVELTFEDVDKIDVAAREAVQCAVEGIKKLSK